MNNKSAGNLFNSDMGTTQKLNALDLIRLKKNRECLDDLILTLETESSSAIREGIILVLAELLESGDYSETERMLLSADPYVRNAAIEIMRSDREKYEPFAERLFHHSERDIRKYALDVFGDFESDKILDLITERFEDSDINVCIAAIEMLGKNRNARKVVGLIEAKMLSEDNVLLQCVSLKVLSKYGKTDNYERILQFFQDDVSSVILIPLTEYLVQVGGEKAIDLILHHCREKHYNDWMIALHAVKSLIRNITSSKSAKKYYDELLQLPLLFEDEAMEWYIRQMLGTYETGDFEYYLEFLKTEEEQGNISEILKFVKIFAHVGELEDIDLLERLAEYSENDSVLETIGEVVMEIKERNGVPQ